MDLWSEDSCRCCGPDTASRTTAGAAHRGMDRLARGHVDPSLGVWRQRTRTSKLQPLALSFSERFWSALPRLAGLSGIYARLVDSSRTASPGPSGLRLDYSSIHLLRGKAATGRTQSLKG